MRLTDAPLVADEGGDNLISCGMSSNIAGRLNLTKFLMDSNGEFFLSFVSHGNPLRSASDPKRTFNNSKVSYVAQF